MTLQDLQALGFQMTPDGRLFVPFSATNYMNAREGNTGEGDNPNAGKFYTEGLDPTDHESQSYVRSYYNDLPSYMAAVNAQGGGSALYSPDLSNIVNPYAGTNNPSRFTYRSDLGGGPATFGDFGGNQGYFLNPKGLGSIEDSPGGSAWTGFRDIASYFAPFVLGGMLGASGAGSEAAAGAGSDLAPVAGGELGAADVAANTGLTTAGDIGAGSTLAGGSTDNYFGDYIAPEGDTGYYGNYGTGTDYSSIDPYGTGVDQYGNPTGQYTDTGQLSSAGSGDFFNPGDTSSGIDWEAVAKKYGVSAAKQLYSAYTGGNQRKTLGQNILGQLSSDPLSAAFSATPFLLALHEANKQGGDINDTLGRLRALESSVSGNQSPYMNAILNPYDQQTGVGRAALLQDQGLRGIRGSSFGDQSLNSYDYTRGLGRGDIASKALLGSTALQGNLIGSELDAITKRNTNRNLLLGAGLSASGRLFQPEKDPFNLSTLLGL